MTAFVLWFLGFPILVNLENHIEHIVTGVNPGLEVSDSLGTFWFLMSGVLFFVGLFKK